MKWGVFSFSGMCACTYCAKILSAFVKIVHPLVSLPQLEEEQLLPDCYLTLTLIVA